MSGIACVLLLTTALAGQPLSLEVDRSAEALVIQFKIAGELPQSVESTLGSGLATEIDYIFRVYGRRRYFPDRKIWKGVAKASATFDAVTGRYRCQVIVNGTTTVSKEVDTAEAARCWLMAPPAVEVPIPRGRRDAFLRVRARAVFSSGTSWLIFPSTEGTDWVEVQLEASPDDR
jgi:Domain of unknown function (DUF4390)